jgi:hypothetical protein
MITVIKASGEHADFDEVKLRNSLKKSGAEEEIIEQVVTEIKKILFDGITTKMIYKKAFEMLKKKHGSFAARYKLKNAIFELGPSGFPFEKFIGELFRKQGYTVRTGVIMKGKCVHHEVDVFAEKDGKQIVVECKFHTDEERKCDVKIPLYIQSRFLDIKSHPENSEKVKEGWVVNNTRFTEDAIRYANCAGLHLLGWDYPKTGSLKEWIDKSGLHPITCLSTMSLQEKQLLLDRGHVLCQEILNKPSLLDPKYFKDKRRKAILEEIRLLLR